jgi:hypothetical protein
VKKLKDDIRSKPSKDRSKWKALHGTAGTMTSKLVTVDHLKTAGTEGEPLFKKFVS